MSEEEKDLVSCQICKEICKRGVSVKCCGARACRACATKKVISSRVCWNEACKVVLNTDALENDENLRSGVEHVKAGTPIPNHILLKLKESQLKANSSGVCDRKGAVSPPSNLAGNFHDDVFVPSTTNKRGLQTEDYDISAKKVKTESSDEQLSEVKDVSKFGSTGYIKDEPKYEIKDPENSDSDIEEGGDDSDIEEGDDIIDIDPNLDLKTRTLFANIKTFLSRKHKQTRPWVRKMARQHGLTLLCHEGKDGKFKFFEISVPDYNISVMQIHKAKRKANKAAFRHMELLLAFYLNFLSYDGSKEELQTKVRTYMNTFTKVANSEPLTWSKQQTLTKKPKKLNKKFSILSPNGNPQTHHESQQQKSHQMYPSSDVNSVSTDPSSSSKPQKLTKSQRKAKKLAKKGKSQQNYQEQNYQRQPQNNQEQSQSRKYQEQPQSYQRQRQDYQEQSKGYQQRTHSYQEQSQKYQEQRQSYQRQRQDYQEQRQSYQRQRQDYQEQSKGYQQQPHEYQRQPQNYQQRPHNYQERPHNYQRR